MNLEDYYDEDLILGTIAVSVIFILVGYIILKYIKYKENIRKNSYPQYLLEFPERYNFGDEMFTKENIKYKELFKTLKEFINPEQNYIVSLSGGVDSMVTLFLLYNVLGRDSSKIYTASVDYNIRKESSDEMRFLKDYLKKYKIKNYSTKVMNITRKGNTNSRKEYEETSREIRYDLYRKIINENELNIENTVILLGHHKDDLRENILNNFLLGRNMTDLKVMKTIVKKGDLVFGRPFLNYEKKDIYEIAHKYKIPYFKDTTPSWSKRGQFRNELLPLLKKMYKGNELIKNIDHQGERSDLLNNIIETSIDDFIKDVTINCDDEQLILSWNEEKYNEKNLFIWSERLSKILHSHGYKMVKRNGLKSMLEKNSDRYCLICKNAYVKKYDNIKILRIIK